MTTLIICCIVLLSSSVNCAIRHVSDNELHLLGEELMVNDVNNANRYIQLSIQGRTQFNSTEDVAPRDLFSIDKKAFEIPTIARIVYLFDNYYTDAGRKEDVTTAELAEELEFLNKAMNTTVMQRAKQFLISKELAPKSDADYLNFLREIWFTIYSRGDRVKGSSAFEHVFLGEFKKGQISGLHNWLNFAHQEKSKHLNYLGWSKKVEFQGKKGSILKVKYKWNTITKPVSSLFIGTSPEFEMALYTVCFLARPNDKCHWNIGGKTFSIQTYAFKYDKLSVIGSAYPII